MSPRLIVLYCGLMLATNAVSTDMVLPAVLSIAAALDSPVAAVQLVVPVFLTASGLGQLLFGPLSDALGRRAVLLAGLGVYTAGALIAGLSDSIGIIVAARVLQGLGCAAGLAMGRAMLRDLHEGAALAAALSLATSLIAIGPMFAPAMGLGLIALGGWRAPFLAMAAFGVGLALIAAFRLPETHPPARRAKVSARHVAAGAWSVLSHRQSGHFLLVATLTNYLIISFLSNAPVLINTAFASGGEALAALFAAMGSAILVGQYVNRRLLPRLGALRVARIAGGVLVVVLGAVAVLAQADLLGLLGFGALMVAFNTAFLVVMTNAAGLVLDPHRDIAGLAAALFGCLTQVVPGLLAVASLPLIGGSLSVWSGIMLIDALAVLGLLALFRPARGKG